MQEDENKVKRGEEGEGEEVKKEKEEVKHTNSSREGYRFREPHDERASIFRLERDDSTGIDLGRTRFKSILDQNK